MIDLCGWWSLKPRGIEIWEDCKIGEAIEWRISTYLSGGTECAVDVEETDCVLEGAGFEGWVDTCCFCHGCAEFD